MSIRPKLPEAEVHRLIAAVNGANAAMRTFYEACGIRDTEPHFAVIEIGMHPYFKDMIRRGGRFVETRPSSTAVETREDTHNEW